MNNNDLTEKYKRLNPSFIVNMMGRLSECDSEKIIEVIEGLTYCINKDILIDGVLCANIKRHDEGIYIKPKQYDLNLNEKNFDERIKLNITNIEEAWSKLDLRSGDAKVEGL